MDLADKYTRDLVLDISPENVSYQMESSVNLLWDLKTTPSPEIKAQIIGKLKQISFNLRDLLDKKVKVALIEQLASVDEELKIEILVTLSFTRDPMVLPLLRKLLSESQNYELKKAAAFGLGEMKFVGSESSLIEALSCDDIEVQLLAVDALSKINDKSVAKDLVAATKTVPMKVKFAACGLLCKFNFDEGYEFIKRTIGHESPVVKKEALLIAREYPHEVLLEPLVKVLDEMTDPEILVIAVDAISKIDHPEVSQHIIKHLRNEKSEVRAAAVKALGELNNPDLARTIAECLKDPAEEVQANAAFALGELKVPDFIFDLLMIIDSPSEKVRISAITSVRSLVFWLSDIGEKNKVTYALMALIKDSSETVRAIAAEALGYTENPDSIEALVEALSDDSPQVKQNATASLGNLNDVRAVPHLVELLKDPNVMIRWNAITALTKLGDKGPLPQIREVLETDTDESVRMAAKAYVDFFDAPPAEPPAA